MLTLSGQGPSRLADQELTEGVANQFIRDNDLYVADMELGGVVARVTQRTAPIEFLLDSGQHQLLAAIYFDRGSSFRKET